MHGCDIIGLEKEDGRSGPMGVEVQERGTVRGLDAVRSLGDFEPQHVAIKRHAALGVGDTERAAHWGDDRGVHKLVSGVSA